MTAVPSLPTGVAPSVAGRWRAEIAWLALFALCLLAVLLAPHWPALTAFPRDWALPVAAWINVAVDPVFGALRPAGRIMAAGFEVPLAAFRAAFHWLPWPAVMLVVAALALRASGWALAVFSVVALAYVVVSGFWAQGMNTLAIVAISVPLSVALGFSLGAQAHRRPWLRRPVEALLDLMQTMPAFAYLIPLLLIFGFGPPAGLVASTIFAMPPMVRNTMLGLRQVPAEVKEAGLMAGATPRQSFWLVELPSALPRLLIGINQTTMAALSMVIIVAIIGGFNDIGWEVLSAMRRAELGRSLMAGGVIVIIAILLDRITLGLAMLRRRRQAVLSKHGLARAALAALALAVALRMGLPGNELMPEAIGREMARALDRRLLDFVGATEWFFGALRDGLSYGVMLPLRLGIANAATPFVWGVTLTPALVVAYLGAVALTAALLTRQSPAAGIAALFTGLMLWTGLPGFPWAGFILAVSLLALVTSGARLALFAIAAQAVILVAGLWLPFMQSVYLVLIAVVICVAIGSALGVWAAHDDRVSAILRPVNDTLQTMPQFVFLIPALMLFRVGEFTALIAIILYAIVPPIRYVEHGLRNLPADTIEAARQMGASGAQLLWRVKVPMAWPAIMLGINQTIMAALSMLVIAALVGTRDLGQQVYVALGRADAGQGLLAGLAIACIALVADRILRALAHRNRGAAIEQEQ